MADAHGKLFKALTPPLGWKCPKRFKLRLGEPWESECSSDSDVYEAAIPEMKLSPTQTLPLLLKNCVDESHDVIQEALSDDDSVTDEMLILASQKFDDKAQQYLGNDESAEILLLALQKFEENYSIDGQLLRCKNLVASLNGQERFRGDSFEELFILMILAKPTGTCWYQKVPVRHNTLQTTVSQLCNSAGFDGHFINHSVRATTAMRFFEAKVDEQLITQRTGHFKQVKNSFYGMYDF